MEYSELALKIEQLSVLLRMLFEQATDLKPEELEAVLGLAYDLTVPIANGIDQEVQHKLAI